MTAVPQAILPSVAERLAELPELAALSHATLSVVEFAFVETAHASGTLLRDPAPDEASIHVLLEGELRVEGSRERLEPGTIFAVGGERDHAAYRAESGVRTATLSARAVRFLSQAPWDAGRAFRRAVVALLERR